MECAPSHRLVRQTGGVLAAVPVPARCDGRPAPDFRGQYPRAVGRCCGGGRGRDGGPDGGRGPADAEGSDRSGEHKPAAERGATGGKGGTAAGLRGQY